MKLNEADSKKVVPVKLGDVIEIMLESNASTGYSWALEPKSDAGLKQLEKPKYLPSNSKSPIRGIKVIGAPGYQIWQYKVVSRRTIKLKLNYARPWEKGSAPAKVWSATFKVK